MYRVKKKVISLFEIYLLHYLIFLHTSQLTVTLSMTSFGGNGLFKLLYWKRSGSIRSLLVARATTRGLLWSLCRIIILNACTVYIVLWFSYNLITIIIGKCIITKTILQLQLYTILLHLVSLRWQLLSCIKVIVYYVIIMPLHWEGWCVEEDSGEQVHGQNCQRWQGLNEANSHSD
jgi:hypothetical protein